MSLLDYLPRVAIRGPQPIAFRPLEYINGKDLSPEVDYQSLAEGYKDFGKSIAAGISSAASGVSGGITGAPAENREADNFNFQKEKIRPLQLQQMQAQTEYTKRRSSGSETVGGGAYDGITENPPVISRPKDNGGPLSGGLIKFPSIDPKGVFSSANRLG
jgi:hypothetical protein